MATYTIDKIEYSSNVYNLQDNVSGYITGISSSDVTTALGFTPLSSSSTLDATKLSGTIPSGCYTDTNTTYTLSNALASHKFTSTLTAGGSGSGTSTATMEFVAGTGITLTDDTTNKKITIASSITDTKNTAGSTDSSSKLYLIGATSQAANPQTYSNSGLFFDNGLYSHISNNDGTSTIGQGPTIVGLENDYGSIFIGSNSEYISSAGVELKSYVDIGNGNFSTYYVMRLSGSGFEIWDNLNMTSPIIIDATEYGPVTNIRYVPDPTTSDRVANKAYVDAGDFKSTSISLTTSGWSSNSQTKSVSGITASNTVIVSPDPASYDAYCEAGVYCSAQGSGTLTFTCDTTPSAALTVNILYK